VAASFRKIGRAVSTHVIVALLTAAVTTIFLLSLFLRPEVVYCVLTRSVIAGACDDPHPPQPNPAHSTPLPLGFDKV
jgi:hypothetical protein